MIVGFSMICQIFNKCYNIAIVVYLYSKRRREFKTRKHTSNEKINKIHFKNKSVLQEHNGGKTAKTKKNES